MSVGCVVSTRSLYARKAAIEVLKLRNERMARIGLTEGHRHLSPVYASFFGQRTRDLMSDLKYSGFFPNVEVRMDARLTSCLKNVFRFSR